MITELKVIATLALIIVLFTFVIAATLFFIASVCSFFMEKIFLKLRRRIKNDKD